MKFNRDDWRVLQHMFITILLMLGLFVPKVSATPLLWDDFESYSLGSSGLYYSDWTPSAAYEVISNPDSPGSSDVQSLSTPGGSINAVYFDTPVVESSGQELQLAFQLNTYDAWDFYSATIYLLDGLDTTATSTKGYAIQIMEKNIAIWRIDARGKYAYYDNERKLLAKYNYTGTMTDFPPTTQAWNNVRFYWKTTGELKLVLNDESVIIANDTTYAPHVKSLSVYAYMNNNSVPGQSLQFDNITLDSVPQGAAALGYTACVINEHPSVADIAPTDDGQYKWFKGTVWSSTVPSISNFTDTNGQLTLVYSGTSGFSLTGTPRLFENEGILPTLSGSKGFYVEFDVRLSNNHADHWPAVWMMPVEHNGGNGEPLGDVYAPDPAGYERWMELDVDEGGFRPGPMGSVISWQGNWSQGGFQSVIKNSWSSTMSSTSLDRTQVHTFGASFDPVHMRVSWWLDGVKYFTAENTVDGNGNPVICVPEVAKLQHFYPIISAQTHGQNVPYDMIVSGVRAYTKP